MSNILTIENGAAILRNDADQRITKLRPMATPVDQLSRYAAARQCRSMTVDYYAVASRPDTTKVGTKATVSNTVDGTITIPVETALIFEPSETVMIGSSIFYITALTPTSITAVQLSGSSSDIKAGDKVLRMGRAAAELDVQTPQFEALPEKKQQYCQIFKAQIEQSTLMRMANKEVGWTFSDQEEVAIYDMRLGMERSFLFGTKARITDPAKKSEIFLTGGIWAQAGKDVRYPAGSLTSADWLKVMSTAFTGHAGSSRKILVAGTDLIEQLSLLEGNQRVMMPGDVVSRWGLDFHEMHSKFGTLYVIHSEVMDSCGHGADGLIIDPEYLTKYVHVPFTANVLDLRTSGQRNTEAVVLTEVSCLVLRYPEAHVRVTANSVKA